jgi:hypothetical protein
MTELSPEIRETLDRLEVDEVDGYWIWMLPPRSVPAAV